MNTPLSSFTALVKFQFDRARLTSEIASVRRQLQGLTGSQERAARQREQSAVRSFVSEMRMQRTHAKALRENEAFDEKRRKAKEKHDNKVARDRTAAALKSQRLAERSLAAGERAALRTQRAEERRYQQWFQQREREDRATQRSLEQRQRAEQRAQDRATREHQRQVTQRTNEEIRQNARRDADAQRRLRQNRPSNTQGGGSGGNTNPWHIGGMAGGLGGLISRGNLAAVGAGAFTQQSFTQANFDIAQAPQFEFITGSAEEAAKQVAFLNKEVDRLSLPLRETSNMYRQLLASTKKGLGIEKTQELFSSFSEISTMLGLSSDAQSRGLRAFSQMASKGQVMS